MNFIFDIGNVLLDFKPEVFLNSIFGDRSMAGKMLETIYKSPEWVKLDEGIITPCEARDIFFMREPGLQPQIQYTMDRLKDMLTPIDDTIELLPAIKNSGHSLYYLSNYHKDLSEYVRKKYGFFGLFDGGVFSCDIHIVKPSPMIYSYLLDRYRLSAKDCLFFDDVEENVAAAQEVGIQGILFTGAQCVMPYL